MNSFKIVTFCTTDEALSASSIAINNILCKIYSYQCLCATLIGLIYAICN